MGSISNNKPDGDKIAVTDNGNYIVDLFFSSPIKVSIYSFKYKIIANQVKSLYHKNQLNVCIIQDVAEAARELKSTVGVVDHGIFSGFTTAVIVACKDGSIKVAGEGGQKPWW